MGNTRNYIQAALQFQQTEGHTSTNALAKYQEAINAFTDNDEKYDLLYAHYQVMWIYSHNSDINSAIPYAKKCLEMLYKSIRTGSIGHFTQTGQFYEEVIRYANNVIAWYTYENTDDTAELEQALEAISQGCNYSQGPEHFYLFDTKVRILLKLNRTEEAFHIVYDCLRESPDFVDFADMKSNKEYLQWKEDRESGNANYSDEEKAFLEKAARIHAKLQNSLLATNPEPFTEHIPEKEILTITELKEDRDIELSDYCYDEENCLLVFKGDLYINGNLDENWYDTQLEGMSWENELYGIVVEGNLVVNGDITFDAPILYVTDDLRSDYLYSGDGHTIIIGDCILKYGVFGQYNDGSLYADIITPYIIAHDHSMPREAYDCESIYIEGGDRRSSVSIGKSTGSGIGWDWYYFEDSNRLLSKDVWDENNQFSVKQFFNLIRQGQNPFIQLK